MNFHRELLILAKQMIDIKARMFFIAFFLAILSSQYTSAENSLRTLSVLKTAQQFSGKVISISDGDTIKVLYQGVARKIRLWGIDCPEKRQAYGNKAKEFTETLSLHQTVTVQEHGKDRYGRILGEIWLPDGRSLNQELVNTGLAWWYRQYAPNNQTLKNLEARARKQEVGLWKDSEPIPPWKWRRMRKQYQ